MVHRSSLQQPSANGLLARLVDWLCQGSGWGLVRRGEGKRRRLSVHHHCMNIVQPATPPDTRYVTSDYQTTWLNMHLRGGSGLILFLNNPLRAHFRNTTPTFLPSLHLGQPTVMALSNVQHKSSIYSNPQYWKHLTPKTKVSQ